MKCSKTMKNGNLPWSAQPQELTVDHRRGVQSYLKENFSKDAPQHTSSFIFIDEKREKNINL